MEKSYVKPGDIERPAAGTTGNGASGDDAPNKAFSEPSPTGRIVAWQTDEWGGHSSVLLRKEGEIDSVEYSDLIEELRGSYRVCGMSWRGYEWVCVDDAFLQEFIADILKLMKPGCELVVREGLMAQEGAGE